MSDTYLDPTDERAVPDRPLTPRTARVKRVGLLDISKPRGDVFLNELERLLGEKGFVVSRYRKPTFTKPAPVDLRREITERCEVVIEALAD